MRSTAWRQRQFSYYTVVMPVAVAIGITVAQALLWYLAVMTARRVVLRHAGWWTVLAYPVAWTAVDTVMSAVLPDGNWGNIGYSQYAFLPAMQIAALFGTGGVTFVISLVASALALWLAFGAQPARTRHAGVAALLVTACALGYGAWRLQQPVAGTDTVFGLVAVDDAIGLHATPAYAEPIWRNYEQQVATLAGQGATIIVLPEKVAVLSPAAAAQVQQRFAALAARLQVWIAIGVGVDDGGRRTNLAWLLSPQGAPARSYQKHHLAPPERDYSPGSDYLVHSVDRSMVGVAICKDMHFASFGRAYGRRQVGLMLVPAWDFQADRFIASGMTTLRGVENGYTVVRSARDGLLTVTDPYGRIVAQRDSAAMPGSALLVRTQVPAPVATLYTRIGDLAGWLCVALMLAGTLWLARRPRAVTPGAPVAVR
ncbi:MAG: nitrilase-related carbon-nitrogen hydrolase [Duganella sp.]